MSYWFVVAGAFVATMFVLMVGAFVVVGALVWFSLLPQPVSTAPAHRTASAKRIYILFIGLNFDHKCFQDK